MPNCVNRARRLRILGRELGKGAGEGSWGKELGKVAGWGKELV
jgi:hypothetical protein